MTSSRPAAVAVVPVLDGRAHLERSLPALLAAGRGLLDEVIVVDDGSIDGSAELAQRLGARVVRSGGVATGPARARNVGVAATRAELVVFVDADVAVHADAIGRLLAILGESDACAAFGSYDAHPPQRNFASLYMNLRHHHGHREPSHAAATFWSGLGAVRREAFLAVGGFDSGAFPRPSVEDIDLGRRLRAAGGRIVRSPEVLGTHLKRWSLAEVLRTDVLRRARPWAQMMLRHPGEFGDLNVSRAERLRALLALGIAALLVLAVLRIVPWWAPPAALALGAACDPGRASVFWRGGGPLFAFAALAFQQLYFLYSGATYLWCAVAQRSPR